jgi:LysM repeat protein
MKQTGALILFIILTIGSFAQGTVTSADSLHNDSISISQANADSLSASNNEVLLSDSVIEICQPELSKIDDTCTMQEPIVRMEESSVVDAMNTQDVNPYNYNYLTVPKGEIICILDSAMPRYVSPCACGVNSPFGYRKWGQYYQFHPGIDLNLKYGEPAYAAFDGTVRLAKMTPGYGNCVIIRHPNGLETLYGHFSGIAVIPGQVVKAGDIIGFCGNTGYSFGAHLHFEIRYMGVPFDPTKVVSMLNYNLICENITIDNSLFKGNTVPPAPKYAYHVIKKGDTLSTIARKYRISVAYLCKLNRITNKTILRPGRTLRIR